MASAGLKAVAEVGVPSFVDFAQDSKVERLKRLLVLECIQDPGNLVRPNYFQIRTGPKQRCKAAEQSRLYFLSFLAAL